MSPFKPDKKISSPSPSSSSPDLSGKKERERNEATRPDPSLHSEQLVSSSSSPPLSAPRQQALLLLVVVTGIYFFFLMFGYYQEQIYHQIDPLTKKKFSYSFFLVFVICVSNSLFSLALLLLQNAGDLKQAFKGVDFYLLKEILFTSLTYAGSMLSTNYALTHVNYPTQVLVKSAKMVPIVLGGFFIFRKTYPWYDYFSVSVITVSLVLFNFAKGGGGGGASRHQADSTVLGILFLCLSLLCDGLTGPRQDRLLGRYTHLGPILMMFLTNFYSVIWTGLASTVLEGSQPYLFLRHHPSGLENFFFFAVSGSLGQLFIYQSLRSFGSLYTSLFTTLRKATSTVMSVYIFGHKLSRVQWVSMLAIFSSLMLQSYFSKKKKKSVKLSTTALPSSSPGEGSVSAGGARESKTKTAKKKEECPGAASAQSKKQQ